MRVKVAMPGRDRKQPGIVLFALARFVVSDAVTFACDGAQVDGIFTQSLSLFLWATFACTVQGFTHMAANKLVGIKTVPGGSPEDPRFAIVTNLDINDAGSAVPFLRQVAETFLRHRMCSPPNTDAMLLAIIGSMSAAQCAELWRQFMAEDEALRFFMSQMRVADVIRGNESGKALERVSIIQGYTFPDTPSTISA